MTQYLENIDVQPFSSLNNYEKYDIAYKISGDNIFYYVSLANDNLNNLSGITSNSFWKRFDDSDFKFSDVWKASYGSSNAVQLKPKISQFGDGYVQKVDMSIFYNALSYEVSLENINNIEVKSLLAFFEYKNSVTPFLCDVPPFVKNRLFLAKSWNHNFISQNVNEITVSFSEFIG